MKKILYSLLSLTLLCCAASCDKIDQDNYTVFSGAVGTWVDGPGVSNPVQRFFLDKFTGVKCVFCPAADQVISAAQQKYEDRLIAVSIHDSSSYTIPFNGDPDLRTEDGDIWSKTFGVNAHPQSLMNRTYNNGAYVLFNPSAGIDNYIEPYLNNAPLAGIDTKCSLNDLQATITTDIEFLSTITEPLTLTLFVMEDGIVTRQKIYGEEDNHNYVQNHVLRDVITDVFGMDVQADGLPGTKRRVVVQYDMSPLWNLDNCHIVALLSYKDTRSVCNSAECEVR